MKTTALTLAFLMAAFVMASGGRWSRYGGRRSRYWGRFTKIAYTVENTITDDVFSAETRLVNSSDSVFFKYMEQAAERRSIFKFECKYFESVPGCFVDEVNGLRGSQADSTFWAFIMRNETTGDCLMNVGVSSYVPKWNDHMVLSFQNYDIFQKLPNCETGAVQRHV